MKLLLSSFALSSLSLLACGGQAVGEPRPSDDVYGGGVVTSLPPNYVNPAPDLVGVWQLTAQDGPIGVTLDEKAPLIQVTILADGHVFRSNCSTDGNAACSTDATYNCYAGTLKGTASAPKLDIPGIHVAVPDQGTIVREGDQILIRYINPTYSAGHFRQVSTDGTLNACGATLE